METTNLTRLALRAIIALEEEVDAHGFYDSRRFTAKDTGTMKSLIEMAEIAEALRHELELTGIEVPPSPKEEYAEN